VKPGEYIYSLAREYKVSPQDIIAANNMTAPYQTTPGQVLRIPQKKEVVATTPEEVKPVVKTTPTYHTVEKNETLYRIGLKYGVSPLDIMAANNIEKPEALVAGSKLRIPVAGQVEPEAQEFKPYIDADASKQKGYVWPVKGKIISTFGQQQTGIFNSGIAISVPENTPVLAIDDAQVIYADEGLKHYGKMVLLRHEQGMVSAYGHNDKLFVKKGDVVKKGQVIALSGDSGIATEPQLHLEIRKNAKAVNPTTLLPQIR
jgi:murein DD-endopeptidase MepM/ murein hydrolase activator NlpD